MELLAFLSLSFCFLTLSGLTFGAESVTSVTKVTVKEDADAILPCILSTNENIESMLFDWKKEGTVQVYTYNNGDHHNNGLTDQNEQFKGRVSHFPEELKHGNASIRIKQTKWEDRGNYTCIFSTIKKFHVELVVERILKVRNVPGAALEPYVTNRNHTNDWALLQCDVKNAYPKPTVEWRDSKNQIIRSEKPQVSEKGDRFHITLNTTVKKTDHYRCVATQKEINHQTHTEIYVYFSGDRSGTGMMRATIVSIIFGIIGIVVV